MIGRKKVLPPELVPAHEAFLEVLEQVEPAKAELVGALPTNRLPGRPFVDALLVLEERLGRAREMMPSWRRAEVETEWVACDEGLQRSLDLARRLREDAPELGGFEGLLGAIQDLLDPLDPFEAAATRFASLRRRIARPTTQPTTRPATRED
jgi:hypothetical protein